MCGIVGFFDPHRFRAFEAVLPEAASRIAHRGPDDSGFFSDPASGVGLAHRRLSILDLSQAGRQPMASPDGKTQIVYNGEVYNFASIRRDLEALGHVFSTGTDTEVILTAYLQWGTDCFCRFVGMFALAIWDGKAKKLVLVRDRLGIKPLYYAHGPGFLAFASELKSLHAFPGLCRELDPDSLALYFHYQYVPAPRSIYRDVKKLAPGHLAEFNGKDLNLGCFWEPPGLDALESFDGGEEEALDRLDSLVRTAVADRLVADVPLGALLSGGIDSSLVTAAMQKYASDPVKTFSIGFWEKGFDEAPYARAVAEHLGTDHTELYVTPKDALDLVESLPWMYDEPFADVSSIPTHLVCRLARQRVTVALSGDAGDEQFAGYVRYWTVAGLARSLFRVPAPARGGLARLLSLCPPGIAETAYRAIKPALPQRFRAERFRDKWDRLLAVLPERRLRELYRMTIAWCTSAEVRELLGRAPVPGSFEAAFDATQGFPMMPRLMRVDQKTYLPDCMFTKVDRASMAVALEVRVPLADHRLVEFTATLPENLLFRQGKGKYLIRKLLARYLPPALFERPKAGFSVPIGKWMRTELKPLVQDLLSGESVKKEGILNPEAVSRVRDEHLSGQKSHDTLLWALLTFRMWSERWL